MKLVVPVGTSLFTNYLDCKNFDHGAYFDDWKRKFGGENFPEINFVTRTFEIPPEIVARRNQNVQAS